MRGSSPKAPKLLKELQGTQRIQTKDLKKNSKVCIQSKRFHKIQRNSKDFDRFKEIQKMNTEIKGKFQRITKYSKRV